MRAARCERRAGVGDGGGRSGAGTEPREEERVMGAAAPALGQNRERKRG